MEFDSQGGYPIRDSRHDRRRVYGQKASAVHDGHCQYVRWRTAHSSQPELVERALSAACEAALEVVAQAKPRPPVMMEIREGHPEEITPIHRGTARHSCIIGRHRSVVICNEVARLLRSMGATVRVYYLHLYRGVVNQSGHIFVPVCPKEA